MPPGEPGWVFGGWLLRLLGRRRKGLPELFLHWRRLGDGEWFILFFRDRPPLVLPKRGFVRQGPEAFQDFLERELGFPVERMRQRMEFLFRLSDYHNPALDAETAELLRQRLETRSRQAVPGMWRVTDQLNNWAAQGPGREKRRRRCRIYGVLLLALGVFALVPGLMEPRIPSLIVVGGLAVFWGLWSLCLREHRPLRPPASCRREAKALLAGRRAADGTKAPAEVRFDETGMTISAGESRRAVPYGDMTGIFETERLWLLVWGGEQALLLQKKDLISGETGDFLPYLQARI